MTNKVLLSQVLDRLSPVCCREHKSTLCITLKAWEEKFNSVYTMCFPITVENKVDLEAPPENFKLVSYVFFSLFHHEELFSCFRLVDVQKCIYVINFS